MTIQKLTKEELEKFKVGDTKVYVVPSWNKARSAQSNANQMKKITGKKFSVFISDRIEGTECFTITVTRKS